MYEPFTSQIEMWSPSTPTNNISINKAPILYPTTANNYHHQAVFYPTGCMICGLSHTKTDDTIITPAPILTKRKRILIQPKKSNSFSKSLRKSVYKLLRICSQITFSIKNYKRKSSVIPFFKQIREIH